MDKIEELLTRGVANIIPDKEELKKLLASGKKLNIYLGIDPTNTKIHLGHAVALRKLNKFAELGHNVTFLIGDFTALVGDTSDKESERPILTPEEIESNFATYKKQAEKFLDFSRIQVRHNSEWLKKLTYEDLLKIKRQFSLNDFISRELIKKRLDEGKSVRLEETEYPIMQGYDSYFMNIDIQLGGTDQIYNMQAGRILQKNLRKKESYIITNCLLHGMDGDKMSKTRGNVIWIEDKPEDIYAKIMAVHDDFILEYYELATNIALSEIEKIKTELRLTNNPIEIKKRLAKIVTAELYDKTKAESAQGQFEKVVQHKELPKYIEPYFTPLTPNSGATIVTALTASEIAGTISEAKRYVQQGGVEYDNKIVKNANEPFIPKQNAILRVGRKDPNKRRRIVIGSPTDSTKPKDSVTIKIK